MIHKHQGSSTNCYVGNMEQSTWISLANLLHFMDVDVKSPKYFQTLFEKIQSQGPIERIDVQRVFQDLLQPDFTVQGYSSNFKDIPGWHELEPVLLLAQPRIYIPAQGAEFVAVGGRIIRQILVVNYTGIPRFLYDLPEFNSYITVDGPSSKLK